MAFRIDSDRIADFCRHWKITEFALFGSVLRDDFRPFRNPFRRREILANQRVIYTASPGPNAETCFRARAALVSREEGLRLLALLDRG